MIAEFRADLDADGRQGPASSDTRAGADVQHHRTSGPGQRATGRWWLAGLAGALAGSIGHQWLFSTLAEDAFISLRYSAQLVAGNGPVFNPGERVEGYSNFLWVVLVAVPGFVAGADLVTVARLLGVACTLAAIVLVALLVRRITGSGWAGVAAAALTAAAGPIAAYGPAGLETPLFTAFVLAAVFALVARRPMLAGLVVAAATMTRPDGAVVGAVLLFWLLVRRDWRPAGQLMLAAGVPVAVWTVWRVGYYGHVMPNPIAAKAGMDLGWQLRSGWTYLVGFAAAMWPLLVLAGVAALLAARRPASPLARPAVALLAVLVTAYMAFFVVAGGDWMPAWRFFAPAVPLLAAIVGIGLATALASAPATAPASEPDGARTGLPRLAAGTAVAVVCALGVFTSIDNPSMLDRVQRWHQAVNELGDLGSWLNRTLPPSTVIASYANGVLSYRTEDLVVVDLLGLTDEHIARHGQREPRGIIGHAAHDWAYVTQQRRPDVIVDNGNGWDHQPSCLVRPEFAADYRPRLFQPAPGRWTMVLVRADRADELTARLAADQQYALASEQCG